MAITKPTTLPRWASLDAWVAATAYLVGERVVNDSGKLYTCTVAGTSAGSGGPTGTGAGIVDNTVTWNYVSATAPAWVNTTSYSVGTRVTNGGNIYQCVTQGTSAGSGGPSGTTHDITDGTVHWAYLATALAARVDPPAGQKDTGWIYGQKPPHTYFDWWMHNVWTWVRWLSDLTNQALTWTALITMIKGLIVSTSTANSAAISASGDGSGAGLVGTGGTDSGSGPGTGVTGLGGGGGGAGLRGEGNTTGAGVVGIGGAAAVGGDFQGGSTYAGVLARGGANGAGLSANAGTGDAAGVSAGGSGIGQGVFGFGGATDGTGVHGLGQAAGLGVYGEGGATDGTGGKFMGGGTGGKGVHGIGVGAGVGGYFENGADVTTGNLTVSAGNISGRHLKGNSSTPTKVAGVGQASSPSNGAITIEGSDMGGLVSVVAGVGVVAGIVVTVSFAASYTNKPTVVISAGDAAAADLATQPYVAPVGSGPYTGFTITTSATSLVNTTTYTWRYHVIENAS